MRMSGGGTQAEGKDCVSGGLGSDESTNGGSPILREATEEGAA